MIPVTGPNSAEYPINHVKMYPLNVGVEFKGVRWS